MKGIIYFALVALSSSVVAQHKQPNQNFQNTISNASESVKEIKTAGVLSNSFPLKAFDRDIRTETSSQSAVVQVLDSIYTWEWDTVLNSWAIDPVRKSINIVYDLDNNKVSEEIQVWNGSVWENQFKYIFTYDSNNYQTSVITQQWHTSAWGNYLRESFIYDTSSNLLTELMQFVSGSGWENAWQLTYIYDVDNNKTSELRKNWNVNVWDTIHQSLYTYSTSNMLLSKINQAYSNSAWVDVTRETHLYDLNNVKDSLLVETWNGSIWTNVYLETFIYDINMNVTIMLRQGWIGGIWENDFQDTSTYDLSNNLTSSLVRTWNGSAWDNQYQNNFTYNINNFLVDEVFKSWSWTGVLESDSTHYYFHTLVAIKDLIQEETGAIIYPNPSNGKFMIRSTSILTSVEVYNMIGERTRFFDNVSPGTFEIIDLTNHAAGTYIVKIAEDKKKYFLKIVLD